MHNYPNLVDRISLKSPSKTSKRKIAEYERASKKINNKHNRMDIAYGYHKIHKKKVIIIVTSWLRLVYICVF